ncbi:hypothetical protein D3C75_1291370 [compost metagenome]
MVCTVLFQNTFLISLRSKANVIAVINPRKKLINPIASVFRSTLKKVSSVNRNLKCFKPTHVCSPKALAGL